jgi:hypothetical protein
MITIGYSTREHNPKFIEYLKKSSGNKKIEVIEKINNGEKSLSEVYNEIIQESKTDIVSYTANLSFGTWSNVESYDVYINGDYFGTDVQNIQITTNDILRIDVVKTDDDLESTIQFNNLLV